MANYTTTKTATGRWFLLSDNYVSVQGVIYSGTTDTNSPDRTTVLRPGLSLTYDSVNGYWENTASGDTYNGILLDEVDLLNGDTSNSVANMSGVIVVAGVVAEDQLLDVHVSATGPSDRLMVHASGTG
tara:strand:- start:655 stop:1038 length:384 start_codon:yes stop_codon:yes gene_type:complete